MKRLAAIFALLIWSVSMTVSAAAGMAVLCVEKNGKAAIEYSMDTHCDEVSDSGAAKGSSAQTVVHCADCTDSPLTTGASTYTPRFSDEAVSLQLTAYVVAYLDTAQDYGPGRVGASASSVENGLMRSTYMGQRQTIVIQQ